jgi:hypothetical protein
LSWVVFYAFKYIKKGGKGENKKALKTNIKGK